MNLKPFLFELITLATNVLAIWRWSYEILKSLKYLEMNLKLFMFELITLATKVSAIWPWSYEMQSLFTNDRIYQFRFSPFSNITKTVSFGSKIQNYLQRKLINKGAWVKTRKTILQMFSAFHAREIRRNPNNLLKLS